jgi:hypothetical protein
MNDALSSDNDVDHYTLLENDWILFSNYICYSFAGGQVKQALGK